MDKKCVIVLDKTLPAGLAANTAVILGISLGRLAPELVGADVTDAAGHIHPGITVLPVPVLQCDDLDTLALPPEVTAVGLTDLAQRCKTYPEYVERMSRTEKPRTIGLGLYGPRKAVEHLTGSLPLLR